jgi:hypothetical protein
MNDETPQSVSECCSQIDVCVREHPTRSLLIAAGVGLVLGFLIRELQSSSPSKRSSRLLDDLQNHLQKLSKRASGAVSDGSGLIQDGVARVRDLGRDHSVHSLIQRIRWLFS